jgi:hypothetical protein
LPRDFYVSYLPKARKPNYNCTALTPGTFGDISKFGCHGCRIAATKDFFQQRWLCFWMAMERTDLIEDMDQTCWQENSRMKKT